MRPGPYQRPFPKNKWISLRLISPLLRDDGGLHNPLVRPTISWKRGIGGVGFFMIFPFDGFFWSQEQLEAKGS